MDFQSLIDILVVRKQISTEARQYREHKVALEKRVGELEARVKRKGEQLASLHEAAKEISKYELELQEKQLEVEEGETQTGPRLCEDEEMRTRRRREDEERQACLQYIRAVCRGEIELGAIEGSETEKERDHIMESQLEIIRGSDEDLVGQMAKLMQENEALGGDVLELQGWIDTMEKNQRF